MSDRKAMRDVNFYASQVSGPSLHIEAVLTIIRSAGCSVVLKTVGGSHCMTLVGGDQVRVKRLADLYQLPHKIKNGATTFTSVTVKVDNPEAVKLN